jgi:hypothetical protein
MKLITTIIFCLAVLVLPVAGQSPSGSPADIKIFDNEAFDRSMAGFDQNIRALDQSLSTLQQFQPKVTRGSQRPAPGLSSMPTSWEAFDLPDSSPIASASAHSEKCKQQPISPDVRCVDVPKLFVRSDPNSFVIGTLEEGDHFRVKAVRKSTEMADDGTVKHRCYFLGDAFGHVDRHNVWVNCDGLEQRKAINPVPRPALPSEVHPPLEPQNRPDIVTSRENLLKHFASEILPENAKGWDGAVNLTLKPEAGPVQICRNYNPAEANNPRTHGFLDCIGSISAADSNLIAKGRFVSSDGRAVMVHLVRPNPENPLLTSREWIMIHRAAVNVTRSPR